MKHTRKPPAATIGLFTFVVLLAWPAAIHAQTNVHVTVEQPYQITKRSRKWTDTTLNSSYINFGTFSIPTGRMLVVEHFSAQIAVNPGERAILRVGCSGVPGVFPAEHHPVLTPQAVFGGARGGIEILSSSLPLRCYGDGSIGGFSVSVRRNSQAPVGGDSLGDSEVAISGFLQDLPPAP